jgi:hypothetical protein
MKLIDRLRNRKNNAETVQEQKSIPLIVDRQGKSFSVSIAKRTYIEHTSKMPFITLYRGVFRPAQKGKRVVVEDRERKTVKLELQSLEKTDEGYILGFASRGYSVQVKLEEAEHGFILSAYSDNQFEKIRFTFCRDKRERLIGLGDTKADNLMNTSVISYPLEATETSGILNTFARKDTRQIESLSASDVILSSQNYLILVNEPLFRAVFEQDRFHIVCPKAPQNIRFFVNADYSSLFGQSSSIRPNGQELPARLQEGIVVTERIKELERSLKTLNANKIPACTTLIRDADWNDADLDLMEKAATRWGHRLILRVSPYIAEGDKDYDEFVKNNLVIKDSKEKVICFKYEGKKRAYIDLTRPTAIQYYKEKLNNALKCSKVIGFLAECPHLIPLNACCKEESPAHLRSIWLKLFQKAVSETLADREESVLLLRGATSQSNNYGVVIAEAKEEKSPAQTAADLIKSMLSLSASGAGLTLMIIGDNDAKLSQDSFKTQTKLASVLPVMIFGENATKLLVKQKAYVQKVIKQRIAILTQINNQLELARIGIPPIAPEFVFTDKDDNFTYKDEKDNIVCFGEKIKVLYNNLHNIVNYKDGDKWRRLLL